MEMRVAATEMEDVDRSSLGGLAAVTRREEAVAAMGRKIRIAPSLTRPTVVRIRSGGRRRKIEAAPEHVQRSG